MEGKGSKLGSYIAACRQEQGISQRELASAAHVNNASISRIEDGTVTNPSPIILKEIAKKLNLNYTHLLTLNDTIEEVDQDFLDIARAAKTMDSDKRQKLIDALKKEFLNPDEAANEERISKVEENANS